MKLFAQEKLLDVKKDYLGQHLHWYIMMAVVVVGVIAILVRGAYIFIQMQHDQTLTVEESTQGRPIFSVKKLEESIQYFNNKNEKYSELLATPPNVTDPS